MVRKIRKAMSLGLVMFVVLGLGMTAHGMKTADEALTLLKNGNERFVEGSSAQPRNAVEKKNMENNAAQDGYAFATILSCADSRVPVERIFDAKIMDVFVVRVAGNVISNDVTASIEYGVVAVHTPIVVILGHTDCGAVGAAALEVKSQSGEITISPAVDSLLERIKPAVRTVKKEHPELKEKALWEASIKQNVWLALEDLFRASQPISDLYGKGMVRIICAEYNMSTGKVKWFEEKKVQDIYRRVMAE